MFCSEEQTVLPRVPCFDKNFIEHFILVNHGFYVSIKQRKGTNSAEDLLSVFREILYIQPLTNNKTYVSVQQPKTLLSWRVLNHVTT
jgi:hypothetical protein